MKIVLMNKTIFQSVNQWTITHIINNNNKFISSRQVKSVKQSEYKQRVLIIAYRRLPESYKLSMLATYDT